MSKINKKNIIKDKNFKNKISEGLDVPIEVLENMPLIKMSGNREISIENFIGLLEYTNQKIRLNTKCGILNIDGADLLAKSMTSEQMIIKGNIQQVSFLV